MPAPDTIPALPDYPHALGTWALVRALATDAAEGLEPDDAQTRRDLYGPNILLQARPRRALSILFDQFKGFIVWLLAAAMALSIWLGDYPEALAVAVVLVINAAIGFVTEWRAIRSIEALRRIAQVRTRVRRGGETISVDAEALVPGDLVLLEAGDLVTADLRLVKAAGLHCDEAVLTGESLPVAKQTHPLDIKTRIPDRANMAFKGTAVTEGTGLGIVTATGSGTQLGRISTLAETAQSDISPLEKRLERLGHRLVAVTLILTAATAAAGILRGLDVARMLETAIALAVAAVPEGLPVVATLSLARGMLRMARRNALVARLSSVETLGATTLILTDKTGTLTENRMSVVRILQDGRTLNIARGADGEVRFREENAQIAADRDRLLTQALQAAVLCNNAALGTPDAVPGQDGSGDPMERALLVAGRAAGLEHDRLRETLPEIEEHAFDPRRKMMATVHRDSDAVLVAIKGAPEAVIGAADKVLTATGEVTLDAAARDAWRARSAAAAGEGLRVLALARKTARDTGTDPFEGLTLLGLACLADPLRADVPAAIGACRRAGVRVVMLTGDHAETAAAIARAAGLADDGIVAVEGAELGDLDEIDAQTAKRLGQADVFARVSPEQKMALARHFQNMGEVVAMTGDGVNDAPALKKADIGVAMGGRGTEVARQAAHMVLKDDAFSTIVSGIEEGRNIFNNIRKFVVYLMSCNLSEVLLVAIAVIAGLPTPLLPLQILFLNLVTDVFPAFALGLSAGHGDVMDRPPRPPSEPVLARAHWLKIAVLGVMIAAVSLSVFGWALLRADYGPDQAITMGFLTLAAAQLWNVFNFRATRSGMFLNEVTRNPLVWAALGLCGALIAVALFQPDLSRILALSYPGHAGAGVAIGASLVPLILWQIIVAFFARK